MYTQKTSQLKPLEFRDQKKWLIIDCKDKVVGRLATEVADLLRGKRNPRYTPNTDSGDHVILINAKDVRFTGNKLNDKTYYWHTGYVGGIKSRTAKEQLENKPEFVIMNAVKGMLGKNSLGRKQLTKLKVYAGSEHEHSAQNPEVYEF